MRGEYDIETVYGQNDTGSPPHAWGIPFEYLLLGFVNRITPTCVGNTDCHRVTLLSDQDHPHMRGEYSMTDLNASYGLGSPPHAWGIQ